MNNSNSLFVSVIIPAFNAESFLKDAVSSVVKQTYPNWEIVIVVDKSIDSTADVAQSLSEKEKRISLKVLPYNCGAAVARNIGLDIARGDVIAFLDADDIWMEDKLEKQIPYFLRQDPPLIVYSDYICFRNDQNRETVVSSSSRLIKYSDIIRTNSICTSSAIYDARLGKIFFPSLPRRQDWALWITLLKTKDSYALSVPLNLVRRRIHSGSLSANIVASYWYNYIVLRRVAGLSRVRSTINLFIHFISAVLRRS